MKRRSSVKKEESNKKQKVEDMPLAKRRASKPDFKPLYLNHRKIIESATKIMDHSQLVALRHLIHSHPEGGFKEFQTQKVVRENLLKVGVSSDEIKDCAITGLVVDIKGTGPSSSHQIKRIALRCELDGLPMPENNQDLPYKTTTDHAHMCGHDGHMVSMISTAQILCNNREKIPENQYVRMLF